MQTPLRHDERFNQFESLLPPQEPPIRLVPRHHARPLPQPASRVAAVDLLIGKPPPARGELEGT